MDDRSTSLLQLPVGTATTPPTGVRWKILALLMAYAGLCHFNRISITVVGSEYFIRKELVTETQMGMVYSSYLFIYTLCMIPGGWLIDRFGPKRALMLLGVGSAILVPLTGLTVFLGPAVLLATLCLIRGLLGVVSAPMHPGAARAVSFWMPAHGRGIANGLVTAAAVIGVASTYYVFGLLMDGVGWPAAFALAGAETLLLTIVWSMYATNRPAQHPDVNAAERQLIEAGDPPAENLHVDDAGESSPSDAHDFVGFAALLRNRSLILLTTSYAMYSYFQYLFFYWMEYYFNKVLHLGANDGRLYATITILTMAVGMLLGGKLLDRVRSRFPGRVGLAIVPMIGLVASAVLLMLGIIDTRPAWVVTFFSLSMGALGMCESSFWVTGVAVGKRNGGLSGAILNAGGNAGGILAPVITPLFSHYFGWQAGLILASVLCVIGAIFWIWIDPEESPDA